MTTEVVHVPEQNRYELRIDGDHAGHIDYVLRDNDLHLTHTEVDKSRREKGLGAQLVEGALTQIRTENNHRLIPDCPFVAHWLEENDGFEDLLTR